MLRPATAITAVLLLVGCSSHNPAVVPVPEPTSTPVFASDDDALAAATEAYVKYVGAVDESLSTYSLQRLVEAAEGKALSSITALVQKYKNAGDHQVGFATVTGTTETDLESVLRSNSDNSTVQIYACLSLADVAVLNAQGSSIVAPDRPDFVRQLVTLVWHQNDKRFIVSDEEVWSNDC